MGNENCYKKASNRFTAAYTCFKKIRHLKAMYLCQKAKERVCIQMKDQQELENIRTQKEKDHANYNNYVKEVGLLESHYIPRELPDKNTLPDEISVMTELALTREKQIIFPKPDQVRLNREGSSDRIDEILTSSM